MNKKVMFELLMKQIHYNPVSIAEYIIMYYTMISDLIVSPTPVQTGIAQQVEVRSLFVTFCSRENTNLLRNF